MGIMDRLAAGGRGAAQSATGGFVDEIYPKILNALPFDDKTGIPREYAGGTAENQYKSEYRADDAGAQAKYPLNFGAGQVLGAAPAALATGGLGAGGQIAAGVGMGALQGAGASENTGSELARDAVRGGALGGAFGAAGNAVSAAAPGLKAAWSKLRQGPPQMQPAMAGASAPRPTQAPASAPTLNKSEGMLPPKGLNAGRYSEIQDIPMPRSPGAQADAVLGSAPTEMAPAASELASAEGDMNVALQKIKNRPNSVPVESPTSLPKPGKIPTFDEADVASSETALRNKEANWQARHNKEYVGKKIDPAEEYKKWEDMKAKRAGEKEMRAAGTVRPGKGRAR